MLTAEELYFKYVMQTWIVSQRKDSGPLINVAFNPPDEHKIHSECVNDTAHVSACARKDMHEI